jgi:hypothetical protein
MAALPSYPASFAFESVPSIATLNEVAYAVTFLSTLPAYALLEGSPTLTTATVTALAWPTKVTDRDGGWSSGSNTRYTAQTPGYYDLSACVEFASSSAGARIAYYRVTTGSNNPGGAGNTTNFADKACSAANATVTRLDLGAASPYLYLDDYVEVYAYQNSGGNLATGTNYWTIALISLGP